jgi:protein-glutamine gamma-glutamyltransferase
MSAILALRVLTYLLVCDGVVALAMAGLIGLPGATLVIAAMLLSWWLEVARARGTVRPTLAWGLVITAAVAIAMDLVYLASTALDGMVHVLLFLIVARLFVRRSLRDIRDSGFLSFFLLVATSSVTFSAGFLLVFLVFVLLGTWMLMLQHVVAETERAGAEAVGAGQARLDLRGPLLRVGVVGAGATFCVAGLLFFVIPRVGQASLPFRNQLTRMVSGFSDRVDLGAFGEIETDQTVVMRVYTPEETTDWLLPNIRWRGVVFDRFDGRAWAVGQPERTFLRRALSGQFQVGAPIGRGKILKQDVYLEPIGTDVLFAAPRALRLELRAAAMSMDDMGSLAAANATARLHYQVESELEAPVAAKTRSATGQLASGERSRYLQLPPLSPRIVRLAREVTAGSGDEYDAARRLNAFFSSEFRYTLAKPETAHDPLEEFLFVRRSGNCEYFAAALAVMLRVLDIPSRVVGGFQRGEWNPYGRYFMVRMSDAHAWVEAYFDGPGWVTLDPSPRLSSHAVAPPSLLALYLDAARMRWYRYVVNWSLQDQRLFASTVHRQARHVSVSLTWPGWWRSKPWLLLAGFVVAAGVVVWLARDLRRPRQRVRRVAGPPRFYTRALRALGRRGLIPEPAETARQFCARARLAAPAWAAPFARITTEYERARFGSTALTEEEMRDVEQCLEILERA